MLFIGVIIVLIAFCCALNYIINKELYPTLIGGFIFLFGICLCVWDVSSPVETTETIFITTEYADYRIPLEGTKLCRIKKVRTEATNFGAIWNDEVKYILLSYEDIDITEKEK